MPQQPSCIRRGIPSLTLIHTFIDRAYSRFTVTWTSSFKEGNELALTAVIDFEIACLR